MDQEKINVKDGILIFNCILTSFLLYTYNEQALVYLLIV